MTWLVKSRGLHTAAAWVLAALVVALLPAMGLNASHSRDVILICIMALAVSGLNLAFGYAGELNLGQAAMYAGGAYATGYLAKNIVNDIGVALLLSLVVGLVLGLITGIPGLRMGGWTLAIMSFFVVLLISPIINLVGEPLGGFSGMTGIPLPELFGAPLDDEGFYVTVVLVTAVWFVIFRNVVKSRHGNALLVLKESPVLASSLGISPYSLKLKAYAIAAIPAALAGCLFAYLDGFIAPDSFHLQLSITLLAASILGGTVSVMGALVGAIVLVLGPGQNAFFQEYALVVYGVFLLLGGVLLNDGIVGVLRRVVSRRRATPSTGVTADVEDAVERKVDVGALAGQPLVLHEVTKSFGGLDVLKGVSMEARPGEVSALIGPNGSGKTTVLNVISGYYRPDGGSITLGSRSLVGLPVHKVGRAGVGRTFQTPLLPSQMTVREVVAAANFDKQRSSFVASALRLPSFWKARAADRRLDGVLRSVGLDQLADTPASSLSLGTRRMVELARALVRSDSLILLDEVAAGLDEVELAELAHVVAALRSAGATIVLVEHNFTFVRAVADRITVLAEGTVIGQGSVEDILTDDKVLKSYLGEGSEVTGTRVRTSNPTEMVETIP